MSDECHASMSDSSMNPVISFPTNEDGETILVTLEDSVMLSDHEISITESGAAVVEDGQQQPLKDVLLVSTMNEGDGLLLTNDCSNAAEDKEHISQNWFTSKTDKQSLQKQGHRWRQGQWTTEENDILKQNIEYYCQEKNIANPNAIIFDMTKDMRKDFYRFIARGLDRPLFSVYRRVIRMYDQKNHMGKYTADEIVKLRELREIHGNDWSTIGATLGRSAGSVRDRCRLMKDSCRYGTWAHDEEMRLAVAVYELTGLQPGEEVHHGLCWADVASRVKTRTDRQCRAKWLNFLNWKQKGGTEWSGAADDYILLEKIVATEAGDETEVDWVELSKGWSCVRSPQWLRSKWWALKRHVTNYQNLPLRDILNTLSVVLLPNRNLRSVAGNAPSIAPKKLAGATTIRLCNSAEGYTLTTASVQLPEGTRTAVIPEDIGQLDSNSLFITSSSNNTFLISNDSISFPLSSMSESLIVQSLPLSEMSTKSETVVVSSSDDRAAGHCHEDMVLLGDTANDTVLVSECVTLPTNSSLHPLSSLSDPLFNSQADGYNQGDS